MAEIRLEAIKEAPPLYSCLQTYAKKNRKAQMFCDDLKTLREFAAEHSVEQLIRYIYDESSIISAIQALPDGDKRDSNLKMLISYARRFSENGIRALCDFIRYMDMVSRGDISLSQAKSAETVSGAVKLMTIHGSKGLEFPITFVSNLSSDRKARSQGKVNTDIKYGIGMRAVRHSEHIVMDTFMYNLIAKTGEIQGLSEEMRLLYVAATRAKEKLIFTSPVSKEEDHKVHLKWVEESIAAARGLIKTEDIYSYEAKTIKGSSKEENTAAIIRPFSEYAYLEYTTIPAKMTATQIGVKSVGDSDDAVIEVERFLKNPTFTKKKIDGKLTGTRKGDAYHKAMELIDFSGGVSQLDKLFDAGKLTFRERECIEDDEVQSFLDSDLCARIVKSGEVHKEFPIFFEYDGYGLPEDEEKPFIQGIADLYFIEGDKIVLVDYKTNKQTNPDILKEEYKGQLKIYAEALEYMTGKKVGECYLWAFTAKTAIKVDI